jgi:type II secretory pathway pseudopilin PulG
MSTRVRRGFVLLEAAVALLVIGLAAAAALDLFAAQLRGVGRTPQLLAATALAQDRLAAIRLLRPDEWPHVPDSLARGQFGAPYAGFRWRASIAPSIEADLYEIHVEVSWDAGAYALSTRETMASSTRGRGRS